MPAMPASVRLVREVARHRPRRYAGETTGRSPFRASAIRRGASRSSASPPRRTAEPDRTHVHGRRSGRLALRGAPRVGLANEPVDRAGRRTEAVGRAHHRGCRCAPPANRAAAVGARQLSRVHAARARDRSAAAGPRGSRRDRVRVVPVDPRGRGRNDSAAASAFRARRALHSSAKTFSSRRTTRASRTPSRESSRRRCCAPCCGGRGGGGEEAAGGSRSLRTVVGAGSSPPPLVGPGRVSSGLAVARRLE